MKPTPGIERMPRAVAEKHFAGRLDAIKAEITSLPTAEKLRLAADMLAVEGLPPSMPRNVVRLALSELEAKR